MYRQSHPFTGWFFIVLSYRLTGKNDYIKPAGVQWTPAAACRKGLFDTLLQVFLHLKSAEKLMIQNERHPSWVSFVTIFLPVAHIF